MMIDSDRPTGELPAVVEDNSLGGDSLDHLEDYDEFAATPGEIPGAKASRIVGLGFIWAAIRRRTRLWVSLGILGLLIGSGLFVTAKPVYQSTATILMVNDQTIDSPTAMQTDALLADDPTFAQQVLKQLKLNETVAQFLRDYTVTDLSNQLLTIAVNAPTAAEAADRANVLSTQYLAFRAGMLQQQLAQINAASAKQVAKAQTALTAVGKQVSQVAAETSSPAQQAKLKALQAKQVAADDYLISVQQTAGSNQAAKQLTVASMTSGSRVIGTSVPALAHSRSKTVLEYVVGGAFGGVVIGMGLIAIMAVTSSRLRRRDDVASALDAPVRLSVATADAGGRRIRRAGRNRDLRRVVTQLRHSLPEGRPGTPALAVVAVDNLKFTATLVLRTAASCAKDGQRVMLADLSGGALARLVKETAPGIHTVANSDGRIVLAVPDPDDLTPAGPLPEGGAGALSAALAEVDLLIALVAVDPAMSADYLSSWATDAVAVVTAGLSTEEKIQSVGELIRGGGIKTVSGVLLGADKSDESLGL
jgi:capsular polysaccharide biosynthesis protein